MASSASSGLLVGYIKEIDEASILPDDIDDDDDDPGDVCMEIVENICDVVKDAELSKKNGSLSPPDWLNLLHKADATLSSMSAMAYNKGWTGYFNTFGMGNEDSAGYIKTKRVNPDLTTPTAPWKDTLRPSPHSTKFSRFTREFNHTSINAVLDSQTADIRDLVSPVVFACAEVYKCTIDSPKGFAIGGDTAVVTCAGGSNGRDALVTKYTLASDRSLRSGWGGLDGDQLGSGFSSPCEQVLVEHPFGILAADLARIKIFNIAKGKLMHTLNSGRVFGGPIIVYEDNILRAGDKGRWASWTKSTLKKHTPAMFGVVRPLRI